MCHFFGVLRSGHYAYIRRAGQPAFDEELANKICAHQQKSGKIYGYRRMWLALKSEGIVRNPKTILRIMQKYNLSSEIRHSRMWIRMGQKLHKCENLLNQDFHADVPDRKWVMDISYIHTKQGIFNLSVIRDLHDRSIVAYKTGTKQIVNPLLDTIRLAMKKEKKVTAELQLHSDQGAQCASKAHFELTKQYGITPSMSRRRNPYDNALAENILEY